MGSAISVITETGDSFSEIELDSGVKDHVEGVFKQMQELLKEGRLTSSTMVDMMIRVEYSEWNSFFLFAIDHLIQSNSMFKHVASVIQRHEIKMENFLKKHVEYGTLKGLLEQMLKIWVDKLMVIEKEIPMQKLFYNLFHKKCGISIFNNVKDAISQIEDEYFDCMGVDVEYPASIDDCRSLVDKHTSITERLIFILNGKNSEFNEYVKSQDIAYLTTPFTITNLFRRFEELKRYASKEE